MIDSESFNPLVIAPTFDNARTLARVLDEINQLNLPAAIVVNDGCNDESPKILQTWKEGGENRVLLTHSENQGKAAALLDGFNRATEMGFTHAVTIDTDGQLDPKQIPELLRVARANPTSLIIGCRDAAADDYPSASQWGRWASNILINWESGANISDSQCGFRVYPLKYIERLKCRASRYGFESEILTCAAWAGMTIEQVRVNCIYNVPEGRVSHFCVWRDSLASAKMHVRLLAISMFPWPEKVLLNSSDTGKIWRRLARWFNPMRTWRDLKCDPREHSRFAAAFAAGVFIANLPLYGVQTLLSLFVAKRFRLNPLPAVAGSSISTPPIGPIMIAVAIAIGHFCLHGTWPLIANFDPRSSGYLTLVKSVLLEWTIGGIICGIILASASYFLLRLMLQWMPVNMQADSTADPAAQARARAHAIPESSA
jgi:glycosyltransferase involved in cell wall biosynthesis